MFTATATHALPRSTAARESTPAALRAARRPTQVAPEASCAEPGSPPGSRSTGLSAEARRAFGELLPVIDRPDLRDLLIQVSDGLGRLWVDVGGRLRLVDSWNASPDAVRRLAIALIAAGGRSVDELHPTGDVRLGDGIRVHVVLPPVSVQGAAISIRVPRTRLLSFDELAAPGWCRPAWQHELRSAVASRQNFLITGGTGTGKTTVLAAMLDLVPPDERIVTIEDVAELRFSHPHRVALEARRANSEGVGAVTLEQLLRESLRMRPDRIVLGECRGAEVVTLLAALNTGHDGGAGTLHASRLGDVPARLEALGALAGLDPPTLARQVQSALHLVVHLTRTGGGRHRVEAIGRFTVRDGALIVSPVGG